ncbi:hypothetical protein, partial [Pseudoalteromonas sp. MMG005]|uniref:hypothetical protein n=1 Tax=Pseudoalteromonas sp. MMG005 TaxID=2822682 RepID=UPI001B3A4BDD
TPMLVVVITGFRALTDSPPDAGQDPEHACLSLLLSQVLEPSLTVFLMKVRIHVVVTNSVSALLLQKIIPM